MSRLRRAVDSSDWMKGPPDAPVTLVEFADFECPYCGQAYRELARVERVAGERLRFVFRHFPLTQMHPYAMVAAEAAEAAGAQGAFWQMHDRLFENQDDLEPDALVSHARALGLDEDRFVRDLQEHRFVADIKRDFMDGVRSGVNGTPTLFINGQRWNGGYTAAELLSAIAGEIGAEGDFPSDFG